MERHVAFVAIAEIGAHIGGPLVGLGENQAVGVVRVDGGAELATTACVSGRFSHEVPSRSQR